MPTCFAPVVAADTQILIIGTMPSEASLAAQEYYAFKHNAFWRIIASIAGIATGEEYAGRLAALQRLHCGLWDNLQYCERAGSLDSAIRHEVPNDFETLLKQYPRITKLLFNGQKSYQFFKRYHSKLLEKYQYAILPSTSPANAGIRYETKLAAWRQEITGQCS